jgi:hypothetical protein
MYVRGPYKGAWLARSVWLPGLTTAYGTCFSPVCGLRRGVRARAPLTRRLARLVDGPPLRRGGPGLPCMQDCWPWDLGIPGTATGN